MSLVLLAGGDSLARNKVARACTLSRPSARDIALRQVIPMRAGKVGARE